MIFVDTDIAIALRDMEPETRRRVAQLDEPPVISIMTRIELEGGVHQHPAGSNQRRRLLDRMLETLPVIYFEHADIHIYGEIIYNIGFVRTLVIDRIIAAQAIARDALLITRNGKHFTPIEGLRLEVWPGLTPPPSAAPR